MPELKKISYIHDRGYPFTTRGMTQSPASQLKSEIEALPPWLRRSIGKASELSTVQRVIKQRQIHTICEEGRCPNRGECYAQKTATFLLMGPTCTRSCGFCQVDKGHAPMPLDPGEPQKVAESVHLLGLRYVVLTSVARDDLPDQGASWFVATMATIRDLNPETQIEVLTPDFWGGQGEGMQTNVSALRRSLVQNPPAITTILKQYGGYKDRCGVVLSTSNRFG